MTDSNQNAVNIIYKWHDMAMLNYQQLYMNLYVSFNAWYRQVTNTPYDRDAIARLKKRFVIWHDYYQGKVMSDLEPVFARIVKVTSERPMQFSRTKWDGVVRSLSDWHGLIEYWYQVRCDLVHGFIDDSDADHRAKVECAYKSLMIFMSEVTSRMRRCFTTDDLAHLELIETLSESAPTIPDSLKIEHEKLQKKFLLSPDIWNVDMEPL